MASDLRNRTPRGRPHTTAKMPRPMGAISQSWSTKVAVAVLITLEIESGSILLFSPPALNQSRKERETHTRQIDGHQQHSRSTHKFANRAKKSRPRIISNADARTTTSGATASITPPPAPTSAPARTRRAPSAPRAGPRTTPPTSAVLPATRPAHRSQVSPRDIEQRQRDEAHSPNRRADHREHVPHDYAAAQASVVATVAAFDAARVTVAVA